MCRHKCSTLYSNLMKTRNTTHDIKSKPCYLKSSNFLCDSNQVVVVLPSSTILSQQLSVISNCSERFSDSVQDIVFSNVPLLKRNLFYRWLYNTYNNLPAVNFMDFTIPVLVIRCKLLALILDTNTKKLDLLKVFWNFRLIEKLVRRQTVVLSNQSKMWKT